MSLKSETPIPKSYILTQPTTQLAKTQPSTHPAPWSQETETVLSLSLRCEKAETHTILIPASSVVLVAPAECSCSTVLDRHLPYTRNAHPCVATSYPRLWSLGVLCAAACAAALPGNPHCTHLITRHMHLVAILCGVSCTCSGRARGRAKRFAQPTRDLEM